MSFQSLIRRYPSCVMHLVSLVYLLAIGMIFGIALSLGEKVHQRRFGHDPVTHQVYGSSTDSSKDASASTVLSCRPKLTGLTGSPPRALHRTCILHWLQPLSSLANRPPHDLNTYLSSPLDLCETLRLRIPVNPRQMAHHFNKAYLQHHQSSSGF